MFYNTQSNRADLIKVPAIEGDVWMRGVQKIHPSVFVGVTLSNVSTNSENTQPSSQGADYDGMKSAIKF